MTGCLKAKWRYKARLWPSAVVLSMGLWALNGCGTVNATGSVSAHHASQSSGCSPSQVAVVVNGKTQCMTIKSPNPSSSSPAPSVSNEWSATPTTFQYWPSNTPAWQKVEALIIGRWWEFMTPAFEKLQSYGFTSSSVLGISIDPTGNTAAESGLELLQQGTSDDSLVLFLAAPRAITTIQEAKTMAEVSTMLISSYAAAFPNATKWPALIVRWMGPNNTYVQLGESGSYADAALANYWGQISGWSVATGTASPSTELLLDQSDVVANLAPSNVISTSLFRDFNMVFTINEAAQWMTTALLHWPSDASATASPSAAPSSSNSSAPSPTTPPSSSSTPPSSPSPSSTNLNVTVTPTPLGIQVRWTAATGATPSQGTVLYNVSGSSRSLSATITNGALLPGIAIGDSVSVLSVQCSPSIFGYNMSSAVEYGTVATQLTEIHALIDPANTDLLWIQYDRWLPNQTPDQAFTDYQVEDVTTHVPLSVTAATVNGGQLELTVTIPSGATVVSGNTIQVTTTTSVVTTSTAEPSVTHVQGVFN